MGILARARDELLVLRHTHAIDRATPTSVTNLCPDEAIGTAADERLAIKRGKERVVEAVLGGARGQAFTDRPSNWTGTLQQALDLDLSETRNRAVFVAVLNAVVRRLGLAQGSIHCRDGEPMRCGQVLSKSLAERFGAKRYGLVGYQPGILAGLVDRFGAERARAVDLNPENIGTASSGAPVWDGRSELGRLVDWCEVGLVTGSSLVNGTIDGIVARFDAAGKPVVFFGNTIFGAAALCGLDRICPLST